MKIKSLSLILLLAACGGKDHTSYTTYLTEEAEALPADIVITASRTYSPSSWDSFERTSQVEGVFEVPKRLLVLEGNSGTGWASLIIGDRKFCYQGTAKSNSHTSDVFELKREKSSLSEDCFGSSGNLTADREVSIWKDDKIKFEINGGGCGSKCSETEALAVISFI